jgi:Tfp pilus assembly protein PilP
MTILLKPVNWFPGISKSIILLILSGCAQPITNVCPPIQKYSFQFNQSLATEIEQLPDSSLIPRVISDYINLRDQLKICRSK